MARHVSIKRLFGDAMSEPVLCTQPLPPPALPPSIPPLPKNPIQNDDSTLFAALPGSFGLLLFFTLIYVILHFLFYPQFYKNPLRRDFGPAAPGNRCNPLAALWFAFRMSDDEFEKHAGLDALTLIEFIRMAMKILFGYGLYGLTVGIISVWIASVYGDSGDWEGRPPGGGPRDRRRSDDVRVGRGGPTRWPPPRSRRPPLRCNVPRRSSSS